ncbi:HDOD domain-containing protein [Pseudoxanthomonas daejeonensis]|uniref:Signal transduction protein n=1 Tax=Pseudoxanthomonas daejeonensis TaxID=266062 RepID=A0ABQ6Z6P4_9GAMM|nr:HDOD domain-containing protein [Pseudoxanthomonas daejeonensis]KAF1694127.1 signal transduction protein [Pseudoxanthomonas daejeonensis]
MPGRSQAGHAADAAPGVDGSDSDPGRQWALPLVESALGHDRVAPGATDDEVVRAAERALSRFASEPQRLPRRPQLLPELLGTLNDDEASGKRIAALIARDPALAAALLRLANSSLYRIQPAPVESLDRAVALIGTEGLRRLVAVALMQPVMRTERGMFGRLPERIWEHTQHAALEGARVAREVEGEDAFAAQLLALLQGLGAIVVVQTLRDEAAGRGQETMPPERVADVLQRWSPRIGRLVAAEWQLSPRLLGALDEQALDDVAAMGGLGRALASAGPAALASMDLGQALA